MAAPAPAPVLSLQLGNIHKSGATGRESLVQMWHVFSKCGKSIEDGRRLENLSWRLWYEDLRPTGEGVSPSHLSTGGHLVGDGHPVKGDRVSDPVGEGDCVDGSRGEWRGEEGLSDPEEGDTTTSDSDSGSDSNSVNDCARESKRNTPGHLCSPRALPAAAAAPPANGNDDDKGNMARTTTTLTASPPGQHASSSTGENATNESYNAAETSDKSDRTPAFATQAGQLQQPRERVHTSHEMVIGGSGSSDNASSRPHSHSRRSSCPAHSSSSSRARPVLNSAIGPLTPAAAAPRSGKKTRRASSFFDQGGERVRTHSQLTPGSVQRIIGAVLPMDFRERPRPTNWTRGVSTSLAVLTSEAEAQAQAQAELVRKEQSSIPLSVTAATGQDPVSTAAVIEGIAENASSPADVFASDQQQKKARPNLAASAESTAEQPRAQRPATRAADVVQQQQHTRADSFRSFVSVTSTLSPPIAPQTEFSVPPPIASEEEQDVTVQSSSVDSTASAPVTSAASSLTLKDEELAQCASTHSSMPNDTGAAAHLLAVPAAIAVAPAMQAGPPKRVNSHHRLQPARPALAGARGSSSNKSSARIGTGAGGKLHRSMSAKGVRILEAPTSALAPQPTEEQQRVKRSSSSNLSTAAGGGGGGPKRNGSSSRLHALRGETASASGASAPAAALASAAVATTSGSGPASIARNGSSTSTLSASSTAAAAGPPRIISADQLAEAYARAGAIAMKRSGSAASLARNRDIIKSEPRSVSRGFELPPQQQQQQQQEEAGVPVPSAASSMANNNPYAPHNSPSSLVPESVVLPPQPRPSPTAYVRGWSHSSIRRPDSPPSSAGAGNAGDLPIPRLVRRQPTEDRQMQPQTQVQAGAAKKKGMFFLSSPTTDSDDEHSFGGRARTSAGEGQPSLDAVSAANVSADAHAAPLVAGTSQQKKHIDGNKPLVGSPLAAGAGAGSEMHRPAAAASTSASKPTAGGDEDEDGAYTDEEDEDESDWSSESTDSSAEERDAASRAAASAAAVARAAAERDREMFAKRVPSAVFNGSGLLSRMLHPEEYARGSANLPLELRRDQSAVQLAPQRGPEGSTAGLERSANNADARNGRITVTGMQASKSTAALNALGANRPLRNGVGTGARSGNALTRLAGPPSGVELDSDSSDDEEGEEARKADSASGSGSGQSGRKDANGRRPTAAQLAALMQRTKSASNVLSQQQKATAAASSTSLVSATPISTPRTIRRNMLSTELTESLRLGLLRERQSRPPRPIVTPVPPPIQASTAAGGGGLAGVMQAVSARFGRQQPNVQNGFQAQQPDQQPEQPKRAYYHTTRQAPLTNASPSAIIRRNSDPSANQTVYYSPGFHHVGW